MHHFSDLIFAANVTHDVDSIVCSGLRPSGKFSDKYHITMCPPNPNFAPPRSSIAFVHTNMKNYMEIAINLDLKYSITARQHLYRNTNTDIHKKCLSSQAVLTTSILHLVDLQCHLCTLI